MKRMLLIAAAIAFAWPAAALAAPPDKNGTPMTRPAVGARPVGKPGGDNNGGPGKPGKPHRPPHHRPPHERPPVAKPPHHRPPHHRPPVGKPPHHRPSVVKPPVVKPPYYRPPVWHKPTASRWWWRNRWTDRLRAPVFVYPRGYGYRHWVAGDRLPMLFLTAPYFYDDFATLGLDPPLPGYRWVRYGPDLLLVNLNTGEVEEVAYGVFY